MHHVELEKNGFTCIPRVISQDECGQILEHIQTPVGAGTRDMLEWSWCQDLAQIIKGVLEENSCIPERYAAIQCTYFEKSAESNWLVPTHQDLSIPVRERIDSLDLSGWSQKQGQYFVQPPDTFLRTLVAARLNLDDCGVQDGPIRFISGSHKEGRFSQNQIDELRQAAPSVSCIANTGDVIVMHPLILHSSTKSTGKSKRRVLHFLFAPRLAPYDLDWSRAV